jgi:8-oxo-dGTP diphosphatase
VLLVQNRRRDGHVDWSTPGGVIDEGETLLEGLTREVAEETGIVVTEWRGPLWEVTAEAPEMGWRLRVEVHLATAFDGELAVDDPDGIVVDAQFVPLGDCRTHLTWPRPGCRPTSRCWHGSTSDSMPAARIGTASTVVPERRWRSPDFLPNPRRIIVRSDDDPSRVRCRVARRVACGMTRTILHVDMDAFYVLRPEAETRAVLRRPS